NRTRTRAHRFARASSLTWAERRGTLRRMPSSDSGQPGDTTSVAQHAEAHLQFIRRAMERSSTFTAVPGLGGAGMGIIGLAAAVLAATQRSDAGWLLVWILAAPAAAGLAVVAMWRKAARSGAPLTGAVGRRF